MREEILKVIDELFILQDSSKAEVFISFYGHVNELKVSVYAPTYHHDLRPIMEDRIYLDTMSKSRFEDFKRKVNSTIDLFVEIQDKVII
jgi:alpha-amylase/alpha-mannosidase (GH57 family)